MARAVPRGWILAGVLVAVAAVVVTAVYVSRPSVSSAVVRHYRGLPPGVHTTTCGPVSRAQTPCVRWAGADAIYVVTWGSGSCPRIPRSVSADRPGLVVIRTFELGGDGACTADLGPTTSVVRLPSLVDSSLAVAVRVDGTTTRLAARGA